MQKAVTFLVSGNLLGYRLEVHKPDGTKAVGTTNPFTFYLEDDVKYFYTCAARGKSAETVLQVDIYNASAANTPVKNKVSQNDLSVMIVDEFVA